MKCPAFEQILSNVPHFTYISKFYLNLCHKIHLHIQIYVAKSIHALKFIPIYVAKSIRALKFIQIYVAKSIAALCPSKNVLEVDRYVDAIFNIGLVVP